MKSNIPSSPVASTANEDTQKKMRQKVFRLAPAQDRQLKEFCAKTDMSIQDVVLKGIDMVLVSKGFPPLR
jgi:hypothetical protein